MELEEIIDFMGFIVSAIVLFWGHYQNMLDWKWTKFLIPSNYSWSRVGLFSYSLYRQVNVFYGVIASYKLSKFCDVWRS